MANLWPEKERDREREEQGRWQTKTNVYYFKFRVDQFYCATNWAKECSCGRGRSIHQFLWRPSECRRRGKNIKPYAMHATCTWRISDAVPPPLPPLPLPHELQYALAINRTLSAEAGLGENRTGRDCGIQLAPIWWLLHCYCCSS